MSLIQFVFVFAALVMLFTLVVLFASELSYLIVKYERK